MSSIYRIDFRPRAAKAFRKLDTPLKRQLSRKLDERRRNPRVPADRLGKHPDCYKIKLRASGIRGIYVVQNRRLTLLVLSIGKRKNEEAYEEAEQELRSLDD